VIHLTDLVVHIAFNILRRAARIKAKWEQGNTGEEEEDLTEHLKFKASNQRPLVILVNVIGTEVNAAGGEEERGGKGNSKPFHDALLTAQSTNCISIMPQKV
jgi:hypothetical protein